MAGKAWFPDLRTQRTQYATQEKLLA